MKTRLTKIGNSWGVRLPKSIIKECGLEEEIMLDVRHKAVILTGVTSVREQWAKQIAEDVLIKPIVSEKGEWQW